MRLGSSARETLRRERWREVERGGGKDRVREEGSVGGGRVSERGGGKDGVREEAQSAYP